METKPWVFNLNPHPPYSPRPNLVPSPRPCQPVQTGPQGGHFNEQRDQEGRSSRWHLILSLILANSWRPGSARGHAAHLTEEETEAPAGLRSPGPGWMPAYWGHPFPGAAKQIGNHASCFPAKCVRGSPSNPVQIKVRVSPWRGFYFLENDFWVFQSKCSDN